ncbi:MAG: LysR family transcriptional regulator [Pseudomonadota bacterium]
MSKPLDRLTLLETFTRISDRGSISAAARDLDLSQASASRQLRELETRLGSQLIRRTTHSLALTPAGQAALADARVLISGWEAFEERHAATDGSIRGPLKIVAPVALGQTFLTDIAVRFQLDHPGVTLEWELEDEPIRFAERGCDCWIKVGVVPDDSLIVRRLGRVERLVVASSDLAAARGVTAPGQLQDLPFIALAPYEGGNLMLSHADGSSVRVPLDPVMTTNNIVSILATVRMGAGAAIMPRWFVADDLASGRLIDVLPNWRAAELDISVAFLPSPHQPRRLTAFLDALDKGIKQIPGIA